MDSKTRSRGQKNLNFPDHTAASRPRSSKNLTDILTPNKPALSYADFHHMITKDPNVYLPKSYGSQQARGAGRKAEKDELVRYMSNLPSYLEKGKNYQDKPLNVGVLDWRRLEKWKYNSNQLPLKNSGYMPSTSSTSYFSTQGSSSGSRDRSSSSAQKTVQPSSLQSHLEASPMKTDSQGKCRQRTYHYDQKVYPFEGSSPSVGLIQENLIKFEGVCASIPDHRVRQKSLCEMDQPCRTKESGVNLEMHKKKEYESNTTLEIAKQQGWRNSDVGSSRKGKLKSTETELKETMQSRKLNHPDCSKESNTVVLLVPRDPSRSKRKPHSTELTSSGFRMPNECGRNSSSEPAILKQFQGSNLSSNVPETLPIPSQGNSKKNLETSNVPSQQMKSPPRSRDIGKKPSVVVLKSSTASHLSDKVDNRNGSQQTVQVKHPSHIRRLSSVMENIIRSAGSRDNSPLRRSSSKDSLSKSSSGKAADNGRARSSPLRRLLDPLFKPKATNVSELAEPQKKEPVKAKSTVNAKTKGAEDSHHKLKKESTPFQALLQVAVKNGLPLLTFAVDNDSDNILAATVRKCSAAEKNSSTSIYTFLSVHEMKKKNTFWPNQGTKTKGQFLPNVVAQMTVSDCRAGTTQVSIDGDKSREFTLFSVDIGQVDHQNATEPQPTNELAAIVVKPLKATQSSLNITLILPGGVHTIPSKGSISTLVERWRSGGSCDCGGWDLGCQLRIFTSQGDSRQFLSSSKSTNVSNEFKLHYQVGQESKLGLSLNPFEESIYSVEFDSSISLLQAFATCAAILDCAGPSGIFNTSNEEGRSSSYVPYPPNSPVERV